MDDDPKTRDMLRRTLQKEGWTVAEAANGREALEPLERSRPALILLDLMMPEMDGFEVLERMRRDEAWRDIPVIIVTAKDLTREEVGPAERPRGQGAAEGRLPAPGPARRRPRHDRAAGRCQRGAGSGASRSATDCEGNAHAEAACTSRTTR